MNKIEEQQSRKKYGADVATQNKQTTDMQR